MPATPSRLAVLRPLAALLLAGSLAACGGGGRGYDAASGPHSYTPPGPPSDPWGPYISEASARFAVPQTWIRQVMRQESGGHQYLNGGLTTSAAGAMGLMQVIPSTYDMLRQRYGLGSDPYDPHDNILAGTAYIREMYDRYGSPGFLAAYNAGPQRLDAYLAGSASLPNETVNYLASIAPRLGTEVAMSGPLSVYGGPVGGGGGLQVAAYSPPPTYTTAPTPPPVAVAPPVQTAAAGWQPDGPVRAEFIADPAPDSDRAGWQQGAPYAAAPSPYAPPARPQQAAWTPAYARPANGVVGAPQPFRLVGVAAPGGPAGPWAVQVGAFSDPSIARQAAEQARAGSRDLAAAAIQIGRTTRPDGETLYRARLVGLSGDAATNACDRLSQAGFSCLTVPPA